MIDFSKEELKAIKFAVDLDLQTLQSMPRKDFTAQNKREKILLIRILEKIESEELEK